jgi:hypothetical protein
MVKTAKPKESIEKRLARVEAYVREQEARTEAINTAVLHPDRGHGGTNRP